MCQYKKSASANGQKVDYNTLTTRKEATNSLAQTGKNVRVFSDSLFKKKFM